MPLTLIVPFVKSVFGVADEKATVTVTGRTWPFETVTGVLGVPPPTTVVVVTYVVVGVVDPVPIPMTDNSAFMFFPVAVTVQFALYSQGVSDGLCKSSAHQ